MQHLLSTRGNTICAHVIGNGNNIADLPSSGTTRVARCTSGCQHTSKKLSNVSNTPHPELNRTNPTSISRRNTVQRNNVKNHLTTPPYWARPRRSSFKKVHESFYFLHEPLMEQCSPPSVPSPQNKPPQQNHNGKMPPIPQLRGIPRGCNTHLYKPAVWSLQSTVTHHTC